LKMVYVEWGHFQKIKKDALFWLFAAYNLNSKSLYYQKPTNYQRVPDPPWGL
jgi:hypothetical protein